MGSGSRAYRITKGQSRGQIEHELAMIPVQEQQAVAELEIRQAVFEQELKQAEAMNLLSQKINRPSTQPIFVESTGAGPVADQKEPNYLFIIVIGAALLWYLKKGKL